MQVILLKDVAKIGRRGEVKEVPQGHAQNFLIPRKLAVPATPDALRKLTVEMKKKEINVGRHDESFEKILEALSGTPFQLSAEANEQGHLFKGIHARDIAKALGEKGMNVAESEIHLETPIKSLGEAKVLMKSGAREKEVVFIIQKA